MPPSAASPPLTDVGGDPQPVHAHAREPRRLRVAADRVELAAPARAVEHHPQHDRHDREDHDRERDLAEQLAAPDVEERVGEDPRVLLVAEHDAGRDRLPARRQQLRALEHEQHPERGQQVGDLQPHDQQAVQRADQQPGGERDRHDRDRRPRQQHEPDRAQHHGEAGVGADREVEAADDHRDGHAERDDPDRRDRLQDRDDVVDASGTPARRRRSRPSRRRTARAGRSAGSGARRRARRRPGSARAGRSRSCVHRQRQRLTVGLAAGTSRTTPPCDEHHDPVGDLEHLVDVRGGDDRPRRRRQLAHLGRDVAPARRGRRRGTARRAPARARASSSQRPTTTFCWLPPESDSIGASGPARRRRRGRGSRSSVALVRSRATRVKKRRTSASVALARTDQPGISACAARSSGTRCTPSADRLGRMARAGSRSPSSSDPARRRAAARRTARRAARTCRRRSARSARAPRPRAARGRTARCRRRRRAPSKRTTVAAARARATAARCRPPARRASPRRSRVRCSGRSKTASEPPVAQHRDAVGERLDLAQPVRDVEDRDALLAQRSGRCANSRSASAADSAEVGSSRISSRGARDSERATAISWRSETPSRDTSSSSAALESRRPRPSATARARGSSRRGDAHGPSSPLASRSSTRFSAVLNPGDRPLRRVLVDGLDARPARVERRAEAHRLAVDQHVPRSGASAPDEDLVQRRLPGAVGPDDRQHLARGQLQAHAAQRLRGAERLRDLVQRDASLRLRDPVGRRGVLGVELRQLRAQVLERLDRVLLEEAPA